jgi:copper homeostasis protein
MLLEICADGLNSAIAAGAGGADRVELCENLAAGGITPSAGAMSVAASDGRCPVHVLIRPRAGDFVYDAPEVRAMRRDIQTASRLGGTSGVVVGALDAQGRVDLALMRALIQAARPMSVTFHRAFDTVLDPLEALEQLIELGVERVLTSGRPGAARGSIDLLANLVQVARGRIMILAGGSITLADLPALAGAGIREVHVGSAAYDGGRVSASKVARLVHAARAVGA